MESEQVPDNMIKSETITSSEEVVVEDVNEEEEEVGNEFVNEEEGKEPEPEGGIQGGWNQFSTAALGFWGQLSENMSQSQAYQSMKNQAKEINESQTMENVRSTTKPVVDKTKEGFSYIVDVMGSYGESLANSTNQGMEYVGTKVEPIKKSVGETYKQTQDSLSSSYDSTKNAINNSQSKVGKKIYFDQFHITRILSIFLCDFVFFGS